MIGQKKKEMRDITNSKRGRDGFPLSFLLGNGGKKHPVVISNNTHGVLKTQGEEDGQSQIISVFSQHTLSLPGKCV